MFYIKKSTFFNIHVFIYVQGLNKTNTRPTLNINLHPQYFPSIPPSSPNKPSPLMIFKNQTCLSILFKTSLPFPFLTLHYLQTKTFNYNQALLDKRRNLDSLKTVFFIAKISFRRK